MEKTVTLQQQRKAFITPRKVFITPKSGAEREGNSVTGSQRDLVPRSHSVGTVVVEEEAKTVAPKSMQSRKKMSCVSLVPFCDHSLRPRLSLTESVQYAARKSLQVSVNRAQPLRPLTRAERGRESTCMCLGLAMENNLHRLPLGHLANAATLISVWHHHFLQTHL